MIKKDTIVLDLETKKTFDEVGGQQNKHLLGVSFVGVYSYKQKKYLGYREEKFDDLLKLLKNAELVIGFNSKYFDFPVLQPYYKDFDLSQISHLDILEEIVNQLGHRLKLESVAQSTLGYGKSGSGLDAIKYFHEQDWESLVKYCLDDVKVTKEVYEYGQDHGHIFYTNYGHKEKIPVSWQKKEDIKIEDLIHKSFKEGQQLEIDYIDDEGNITKRKIDIKRIDGTIIRAHCHLRDAIRKFDLYKIKKAKVVGKMANFQGFLF
jgi:hypothetical protein